MHTPCPLLVKSGHEGGHLRSPLYTQERTFIAAIGMSALGQKRTSAALFDHLIGAGEKGFWNCNAEHFGGPKIDIQIKLRGLLHREFTRLRTFQYPVDISRGATEKVGVAWAITH